MSPRNSNGAVLGAAADIQVLLEGLGHKRTPSAISFQQLEEGQAFEPRNTQSSSKNSRQ